MDAGSERTDEEKNLRECRRLWRAWRTIHELCQDRGYELAEEEVKISFDDFVAKFTDEYKIARRELMQFSARPSEAMVKKFRHPPTPSNPHPEEVGTIWVEFIPEVSIGISAIKGFVERCQTQNHRAGIIVTRNPLSPQARKTISATSQFAQTDCFMEEELLVNITHHELVPKHVVLSRDEKAALLARYRLKDTQLPRILQTDPIARYLGLRRSQVVKIIRNSETAGRYASYRLCV